MGYRSAGIRIEDMFHRDLFSSQVMDSLSSTVVLFFSRCVEVTIYEFIWLCHPTSPPIPYSLQPRKHYLFFIILRKIFRAGDTVFLPNAFIIKHENDRLTVFS
uniref:Putative ovule protein n=1 Tax=Solanum chacoense TaxID=4108 RepID=A0A0V0I484_SOLCH